MKLSVGDLKFDERGLLPAVVQDARTREVLTVAYVSEESLRRTLEEGETWFYSRSRGELWHKGATSGNTQRVRAVVADCDSDAVVILAESAGPACHTGARTCFHKEIEGAPAAAGTEGADGGGADGVRGDDASAAADAGGLGAALEDLHAVVEGRRRERPEGSYTTYLFGQGLDKILKKVGEESAETIIAAKNEDRAALVGEVSDLLYHLTVLLVERGVSPGEVSSELRRRAAGR
jgi:phosphoribosyl-ATP pyrophosphohydrolase/phosphoribosyl-AMP cyclohydrolase